jgi:hypothetical protein
MNRAHPNPFPVHTPMSRLTSFAGVMVLALGMVACGGGDPPPPQAAYTPPPPPAPLDDSDRLYYDTTGGIADSVRTVLRTPEEFVEVWGQATSRQADPPAAPTIDFTRRMAVLVGAGRMTPEDQIRVDSVGIRTVTDAEGAEEDVLVVIVRTIRGCGRFALDAYPLEIVSVPRHEGDVRFLDRSEQDPNCEEPTLREDAL